MQKPVETRSGRIIIRSSRVKETTVTGEELSNPDAQPLTNAELEAMPPVEQTHIAKPKTIVAIRFDATDIDALCCEERTNEPG